MTIWWLDVLDLEFIEKNREFLNLKISYNKDDFKNYLQKNRDYVIDVLSIDRYTPKPRKDIAKWSEIPVYYDYMFDLFNPKSKNDFELDGVKISDDIMKEFLKEYVQVFDASDEKEVWFNKIKEVAAHHNFAIDNKLYKQNPDAYSGNVADACAIIRLAVTGRKNSPDLYSICSVLKNEKTKDKILQFVNLI